MSLLLDQPNTKEELTLNEAEFTREGDILLQKVCNEEGIDLQALESLTEAKVFNRPSKQNKIKSLQGRSALIIAKEKNDPMFNKMMFLRRNYFKAMKQLKKKYAGLGVKRVMEAFRGGKLVEPSSVRSA